MGMDTFRCTPPPQLFASTNRHTHTTGTPTPFSPGPAKASQRTNSACTFLTVIAFRLPIHSRVSEEQPLAMSRRGPRCRSC